MGELPFEKIKRNVLIKKEADTSKDYGKKPEERSIKEHIEYGIININKPAGPTSHQVSDYVKKILSLKRAGHGGTLDPKVSGVLPIALEKATRIVQTLLKSGKEYVALMHLHKEIPEDKIREIAKEFTGKIKQIPPIKSSVKRQLREREIYYFEILEIDGRDVLFRIGCEAGTYIRKLIFDIGKELGIGANMKQLVRTKVGIFTDKNWHSLQDLKDAYEFYKEGNEEEIKEIILPFEKAVEHLPKIWVLDTTVDSLCHGAPLYINGISKLNDKIDKEDLVAIFTLKNELICIGKAEINSDDIIKENRGVAVKNNKVFMPCNIYPKWKTDTLSK